MKNILYTFIFNNDTNPYNCLGICSQIKKINLANALFVFDNKETYDSYKEYIITEKEYISYIADYSTSRISDILKSYYNRYKYFLISGHSKVLINQNYLINKKENLITKPIAFSDNKKILGALFSLDLLLKNNIDIHSLMTNIDTSLFDIQTQNLPIKVLEETKNENIKKTENTVCLYENHNCLFAALKGSKHFIDSMAYFNKNNNKIYSVDNNVMGDVINYSENKIKIVWETTEQKKIEHEYVKNENIYYVS